MIKYPKGKKFSLCLTHDVDRIKKSHQYLTYFLKSKNIYHLKSFFSKKDPYWNFEKIIEIENKYKVKSTFFFLNESEKFKLLNPKNWKVSLGRYNITKEKVKNIIKKLDNEGWEIGVHGSYNSFKDYDLLKKEKTQLEKIIDHKIIGVRQHYFNLNNNTWKLQSKTGFKYDSSFGFNDGNIGFFNNKYIPFNPIKNKEFLVLPNTIMDWCLMGKKNVEDEYMKIIDIAEERNAVLTINWHQRVFNEKEFPGYSETYEKIIKECKKRGAWIGKCIDIYKLFKHSK